MASISVRRQSRQLTQEEQTRDAILRETLLDGAAWEPESGLVMDVVAGLIDAEMVEDHASPSVNAFGLLPAILGHSSPLSSFFNNFP